MADESINYMLSNEQPKPADQMTIEELKMFELRFKATLFDLGEKIQINRNNLIIVQTELANREKKV